MNSSLARQGRTRLALRWPGLRNQLEAASSRDEELDALCAAYEEACLAFDLWSRSDERNAAKRADDYRQLVRDIELDIRRWVAFPAE